MLSERKEFDKFSQKRRCNNRSLTLCLVRRNTCNDELAFNVNFNVRLQNKDFVHTQCIPLYFVTKLLQGTPKKCKVRDKRLITEIIEQPLIEKWYAVRQFFTLNSLLNPPAKPQKKKFSKSLCRLVKKFEGIRKIQKILC